MECIQKIEHAVGRVIRRDISGLKRVAEGNILAAAKSILAEPNCHVGIVTGFFVRYATPPSPETDGLIGAGQLAAALAAAGRQVTVITDAPCAKAMWAILKVIPESNIRLEVTGTDRNSVLALRKRLEAEDNAITHMLAIERCAPGSDGKPHREHGWDISEDTAPMELLFEDAGWNKTWVTIGIGDGGNEIGMGNVPFDVVQSDIPNGELIAAQTKADFLIVASVSNWGGYALVAALAALDGGSSSKFFAYLCPIWDYKMLWAAVYEGQAIDDSRLDRKGVPQMSVDRLPWVEHAELIEELRELVINNNGAES